MVRRELVFREFELNPDPVEFERRRADAYASNNQMLRDTDQGFRYLERQPDGTRTVKDRPGKHALLAAAGAFRDSSTDGVSPLGGVNYFDYDVRGKNIQLNAFFANLADLDVFDGDRYAVECARLHSTGAGPAPGVSIDIMFHPRGATGPVTLTLQQSSEGLRVVGTAFARSG